MILLTIYKILGLFSPFLVHKATNPANARFGQLGARFLDGADFVHHVDLPPQTAQLQATVRWLFAGPHHTTNLNLFCLGHAKITGVVAQ